jgi:hypothetical protein
MKGDIVGSALGCVGAIVMKGDILGSALGCVGSIVMKGGIVGRKIFSLIAQSLV